MGVAPITDRIKDSNGRNFSIAFCFILDENELTYDWGIQ